MDEGFEDMNVKEFEYMLVSERTFLKRLLALGVSDEARAEIEQRLADIAEIVES